MLNRFRIDVRVCLAALLTIGAAYQSAAQTNIEANGPLTLPDTFMITPGQDLTESDPADSPSPNAAAPATQPLPASPKEHAEECDSDAPTIGGAVGVMSTVERPGPERERQPLGLPKSTDGIPSPQAHGAVASSSLSTESPDSVPERTDALAAIRKLDPRVNEVTKVLGALAVVIGLLFMLRAAFRRAGGMMAMGSAGRPSGVLEILARYPVGRGQSLMLLKMARRIVLVHHHGTAMTALSEVSDPDEVAALLARMESGANARHAGRFRKTFSQFMVDQEHAAPLDGSATPTIVDGTKQVRGALPPPDAELVDLTRRSGTWLNRLLNRRTA